MLPPMIYVILLGLAGVLGILFFGLINMVRRDEAGARAQRSQQFMRWRVLAQAGVILLLALLALVFS